MSRIDNQRRLFLELWEELRPWWRRDPGLPARINDWLVRHRAGSRDRRLYRELVFTGLRMLPLIEDADADHVVALVASQAANNKATRGFVETFAKEELAADLPAEDLLPSWFAEEAGDGVDESHRAALLRRAAVWIRLQTDAPDRVRQELLQLGIQPHDHPVLPNAWKLPTDARVNQTQALSRGEIEIQDVGSQALLAAIPDAPRGQWLDACAGAGGKTLQLAGMLGASGQVVAHDIRSAALHELEQRARRAGLRNIRIERHPEGEFDGVLIDAPCSGTGTWRRSPHLKWTTQPATIAAAAERQLAVLAKFAALVRDGGSLIYATCSLCRRENDGVLDSFLELHPEFEPAPLRNPVSGDALPTGRWWVLPAELDSDGFFVAHLRRR